MANNPLHKRNEQGTEALDDLARMGIKADECGLDKLSNTELFRLRNLVFQYGSQEIIKLILTRRSQH